MKELNMRAWSIGLLLAILSWAARADQPVTNGELTRLVSQQTFDVYYVPFNTVMRARFEAGGDAIAVSSQGTRKGRWRINPADQFCLSWGSRPETCSDVMALDNGTYKLLSGGQPFHLWAKSACSE
jgi:hypothetical protein